MIWEQIIKYHRNPPSTRILRSIHIQKQYDEWLKNENNITNLKKILFVCDQSWDLRFNRFPYHFTDNTECYVLWSKIPLHYDSIEYIIQNYTPFQNYVYFTNKDNNKSIPEIFHSHIFVKS